MPLVSNRYAMALFNLSMQENAIDDYLEELVAVTEIFKSEIKFREYLLCPSNNVFHKKQILINIFKDRIGKNNLNFLLILLEKNRLKYLGEICSEFVKITDHERNILDIKVITASTLEDQYLEIIKEKFKQMYDSSDVKVTEEIDESLIGGIKVVIGDKLFDASVKSKLSQLRLAVTV